MYDKYVFLNAYLTKEVFVATSYTLKGN